MELHPSVVVEHINLAIPGNRLCRHGLNLRHSGNINLNEDGIAVRIPDGLYNRLTISRVSFSNDDSGPFAGESFGHSFAHAGAAPGHNGNLIF
jgi:hypothetical protein